MNINQVVIGGNLTRDVELKYTQSNMAIGTFGIANNRKYKTASGEQREEALFVDCTAWGKTAEIIAQYFTKGKPICIVGRLKLDQWEDKNDGGKRSKLSVTVDSFSFAGGTKGDAAKEDGYKPATTRSTALKPKEVKTNDSGYEPITEDDVPF